MKRSLQQRWRGLQGEGEEDGGEEEGEGEEEEEEEGGTEDEEDNQLLWTNLTRMKVSIEAEM